MKVNVCLFGPMQKYGDKDKFQMEFEEGATLANLLDRLKIEDRIYIVILINGRRAYDEDEPLSDGAEVLIMAPTGGG
ncbi:MAG: MoaD/ThiS family protein [Firmicutes bacterium]|nr:MoaD/ThiS family protein [Bacillota bacterium]HXL03585.1 MoaD/ThiS family protein [Bacillota bacterium]